MTTKKIRYFPAGANIDYLTSSRKLEVKKPQQRHKTGDNENKSEVSTSQTSCSCGMSHEATHNCHKCPSWPYPQQPPMKAKKRLQWCMSSKACYVPMLEPGYKCGTIHTLAIQGKRAFRSLVDYVSAHPKAIYKKDSMGNTPLMLACAAHDQPFDGVNFLLARSRLALIQAENQEGLTALHFAVLNDQPDVVRLLLKKKARVDAGTRQIEGKKYGLTPLHLTLIGHGNRECQSNSCFYILLDHGADVFIELVEAAYLDSDSAKLRYECECGGCWSTEIGMEYVVPPALIRPRSLLAPPDSNIQDRQTSAGPAFNIAVYINNHWQAETLLTRFPAIDLNYIDGFDNSPLFNAVTNSSAHMIRFLIRNGADVNTRFSQWYNNNTPLHILLSHQTQQLVSNLLCGWCQEIPTGDVKDVYDSLLDCSQVDIHIKNNRDETPLFLAVKQGHLYACKKLLDRGANPLDTDWFGRSVLSLACNLDPCYVRKDMVQLLLNTGIGPFLSLKAHRTVSTLLWIVYNNSDSSTMQILHAAGAITHDHLRDMLAEADIETNFTSKEKAQAMERFRHTLRRLMSSPRSLLSITLMHFSKAAGIGSPAQRALALNSLVQPDPDGCVFELVWWLMKEAHLFQLPLGSTEPQCK